MKKFRYDTKSIRSGLTLATLLCWILPIIIIVTMFSVLVNYYNDRNLEQAAELGMENAMHRVELRLLYGEACSFTIFEPRPGRILARILLPGLPAIGAATTDNKRQPQTRKHNETPYPESENAVK